MTEIPDHPKNTLFSSSNSDWSNKTFSENSEDDWPRAVVDSIDRLCCDGRVRDPEGSRTLVAATRSRARAPAEPRPRPKSIPWSRHGSPRHRPTCHSMQPKQKPRLACEAKRRQKWSPFEDHHLLTRMTSGWVSKTQRKSPTGGVC